MPAWLRSLKPRRMISSAAARSSRTCGCSTSPVVTEPFHTRGEGRRRRYRRRHLSQSARSGARASCGGEKLNIRFEEGDAENLPVAAGVFDLVVSMFGAMFAPRPDLVAAELRRVCRSGGQIAMANWTPSGFIGAVFRATAKHVAPPSGVPSPLQWGVEATVRERLGADVKDLQVTRRLAQLKFPFSVPETVEFYRVHYGPTLKAFAGLGETAQAALRRDLEDVYVQYNDARDGTTCIGAEYLEVVGMRT